ncbi:MAG: NUDIX hydrolase [Thermoproteota archaeon]|nr:NUDIX hydrolase [Thermoproteota archaeon]
MSTKQETDYIPTEQYNQITELMPIASVEAVIQIDGALLFLKRNNQPAKGEWWFPGGRIKKGETLQEALQREVKEETGLTVTQYKLINVYSRVFRNATT